MIQNKEIKCPHGNILYSDNTDNGTRSIHAGIPKCCFDMLCTPAIGDGFSIVDRNNKTKRIHQGMSENNLIGG